MTGEALTLLSVKYGDAALLRRNASLTRRLNPDTEYDWIVVNNDFDPVLEAKPGAFTVIPGAERELRGDRGSYHHAAGIMLGLRAVQSRYVLIVDHDFFVVRPNWMRDLLEHMSARGLAFFGSIWHPRWSYQPRDFPSVHFLWIDLEQVSVNALDFTPDLGGDPLDNIISHPRTPLPAALRTLLQTGRFRDTGWRVRARYRRSGLPWETLTTHWNRAAALEAAPWLHRAFQAVLPAMFNPYPPVSSAFVADSFLRERFPRAYALGWEEFWWRGEPFALHLRGVGRGVAGTDDSAELERVLGALELRD